MQAIKANKVYTVDKISKAEYLAQGYDIVDDEGHVIERAPQSTVLYSVYEKVLKENEALKAELEALKSTPKAIEDMSVAELKAYAETNGIDIGQSTSRDGILKKIKDAE